MKRKFCVALMMLATVSSAMSSAVSLDVDFVKGLIAIPSESKNIPECNRATAYLRNYLEKRGVHCHVARTAEGRDALYASTVAGPECEYGFVTHIDVVDAISPDQFQPKVVGNELWGRGACDTKLNAALIAQLLVELKGKASVGCFFATDEDGCVGKVPTCTMLLKAGYRPTKMVIVGDTMGDVTNVLFTAQKGHWGFKLTAKGKAGHSSVPWKLDNAIPKLTKAMDAIARAYPPATNDAYVSLLSPTIIRGGDVPNGIPGEASVTYSFRYVGKDDVANLRELVIRETGLVPETLYCVPPVVNDPNDPLVESMFLALKDRFGPTFRKVKMVAATDAFQFSHLGLATVIYCPDAHGAHQADEHGSLSSAEAYLNFFISYFTR